MVLSSCYHSQQNTLIVPSRKGAVSAALEFIHTKTVFKMDHVEITKRAYVHALVSVLNDQSNYYRHGAADELRALLIVFNVPGDEIDKFARDTRDAFNLAAVKDVRPFGQNKVVKEQQFGRRLRSLKAFTDIIQPFNDSKK